MIIEAYEAERDAYGDIFDQMYRLRARQFGERRRCQAAVQNGLEKDRFDELNPMYICVISESRQLLAALRLLPTTGPHMLWDVFPEVMGDAGIVSNPLVLECSRFCVDAEAAAEIGPEGINPVTRELLCEMFTTAQSAGIQNIISVCDTDVERVLLGAGCVFERLGPICKYDDRKIVAGMSPVNDAIIEAMQASQQGRVA